jgi:molecular chaperone HscA
MGQLMDVIIPRNSKIPTKAGRQYTTHTDGQTNMRISVYQGERDRVIENRKLAEFTLTGIPAMPAGLPKVDIRFSLDADGILKVSAVELRSGVSQNIEVKPQYGLTDEEVEKMLLDSITHAKQDIVYRGLMEARTEAEHVIFATRKFIRQNHSLLEADVLAELDKRAAELETLTQGTNRDAINAAMDDLNTYARPYAEIAMNATIQVAMKDKHI